MKVFLLSLVLGQVFSEADIPFGTLLGSNKNVPGFSNSNSSYVSNSPNFEKSTYSGMKWQCVEYARRYLILRKNLTFESVECASDIWHLNYLHLSVDFSPPFKIKLNRVPNGSLCKPSIGDLLIYKRLDVEIIYGHVAVIVDIDDKFVYIGEQNWDNHYWPSNYARALELKYESGKYFIVDKAPLYGWMSYGKKTSQTECFDETCQTCSQINLNYTQSNCYYQ